MLRKGMVGVIVFLMFASVGAAAGSFSGDFTIHYGGEEQGQPTLISWQAPLLEIDGLVFKDLNRNGVLDRYEDWRLAPRERALDLLGKMELEEKIAQMIHITLYSPQDKWFSEQNVGFALAYNYLAEEPRQAAQMANRLQMLSESSRWGIPLVISMDAIMGVSWVKGTTLYPDQLGLGATRDPELVRRLSDMQRKEMLALGVRMTMSPIADLATEPRWGRFQECFSEDVDLVVQMVTAAVEGLQAGSELNPQSILVSVKHFPGSGPQQDGWDGNPLVFDEGSLSIHLRPFEAAIAAGAGSIMPYGYSTVPYLGGDAVERTAHESRTVMTELLREKLGYDGLIQTDWGLKHLDAALAGADVLGGAGIREIQRLAGGLALEQVDEKVLRILETKFKLGLFENPYVDPDYAAEFVGNEEHLALAYEAAARSLTLLKHDFSGSPFEKGTILVGGSLADDADALNSGWKVTRETATSIFQAIAAAADSPVIAFTAEMPQEQLEAAGCAIVVVGEPASTHQPPWGVDNLEIPAEDLELLRRAKAAELPTISIVVLSRPYVLTELVELSDAVLVVYRPGVSKGAEAIVDALAGRLPIGGRLPVQLPRSMEQVRNQREDLGLDISDPLYDLGYGIKVDSFHKE